MELLIAIISGAATGNGVGTALSRINLGTLGNTLAGGAGGLLSGVLLSLFGGGQMEAVQGMAEAVGGIDTGALIGQVASGGFGGIIVTVLAGLLKNRG